MLDDVINTLTAACTTCGNAGFAPSAGVPRVDTLLRFLHMWKTLVAHCQRRRLYANRS